MNIIFSSRGFAEITNLGDTVQVFFDGSTRKGTVTMVTQRGINLKDDTGVTFYKWEHVKSVSKKEVTIR